MAHELFLALASTVLRVGVFFVEDFVLRMTELLVAVGPRALLVCSVLMLLCACSVGVVCLSWQCFLIIWLLPYLPYVLHRRRLPVLAGHFGLSHCVTCMFSRCRLSARLLPYQPTRRCPRSLVSSAIYSLHRLEVSSVGVGRAIWGTLLHVRRPDADVVCL